MQTQQQLVDMNAARMSPVPAPLQEKEGGGGAAGTLTRKGEAKPNYHWVQRRCQSPSIPKGTNVRRNHWIGEKIVAIHTKSGTTESVVCEGIRAEPGTGLWAFIIRSHESIPHSMIHWVAMPFRGA